MDFARSKDIKLLLQFRMKDIMIRQSMTPSSNDDIAHTVSKSSSDASQGANLPTVINSHKRSRPVNLAAASVDNMRNVMQRQSMLSSASSHNQNAAVTNALNLSKSMTPSQQMEVIQAATRLGLIPPTKPKVSNAAMAPPVSAPASNASNSAVMTMAKLIEERVAQANATAVATTPSTNNAIDFRGLYEQEVVKRMCLESQIQVYEHERVRIADVISRFFLLQQANQMGISAPVEQQRILEAQLQQYLGLPANMLSSASAAAAQMRTPPSASPTLPTASPSSNTPMADVNLINHLSALLHKKQ